MTPLGVALGAVLLLLVVWNTLITERQVKHGTEIRNQALEIHNLKRRMAKMDGHLDGATLPPGGY